MSCVTTSAAKTAISILRLPDVMRRTGLSRSSVFLAVKRGEFPAQIPLFGRATGWVSTEVDAWISARVAAAGAAHRATEKAAKAVGSAL